jgi:hypothetical protein
MRLETKTVRTIVKCGIEKNLEVKVAHWHVSEIQTILGGNSYRLR